MHKLFHHLILSLTGYAVVKLDKLSNIFCKSCILVLQQIKSKLTRLMSLFLNTTVFYPQKFGFCNLDSSFLERTRICGIIATSYDTVGLDWTLKNLSLKTKQSIKVILKCYKLKIIKIYSSFYGNLILVGS